INDTSLYGIAEAYTSVSIEVRGRNLVVFIPTQTDDFLAEEESVKPASKAVATEEETLKRSYTRLTGIRSNKAEVCFCLKNKLVVVIQRHIILVVEHPLVIFGPHEFLSVGNSSVVNLPPERVRRRKRETQR